MSWNHYIREELDVITVVKDLIEEMGLKRKSRKEEVRLPRQYLMWFLRLHTDLNHKSIAAMFNRVHHTTSINSCNVITTFFELQDSRFLTATKTLREYLDQYEFDKDHKIMEKGWVQLTIKTDSELRSMVLDSVNEDPDTNISKYLRKIIREHELKKRNK